MSQAKLLDSFADALDMLFNIFEVELSIQVSKALLVRWEQKYRNDSIPEYDHVYIHGSYAYAFDALLWSFDNIDLPPPPLRSSKCYCLLGILLLGIRFTHFFCVSTPAVIVKTFLCP